MGRDTREASDRAEGERVSGTNGLSPIAQLSERQKCPEAPSKKKYATTEQAWKAARRSSAQSGLPIAPYACAGCGGFHLTRKVDGSDVLTRQAGAKVVTGAQRKHASTHPVFGKVVARQTLPEPESAIVAGNQDARRKMLAAWLSENPTPTTREAAEALSVSMPTARLDLRALGYTQSNRRARWAASASERPQEPNSGASAAWTAVDAVQVAHLLTGDLRAAYEAIGWDMRIEVRPRG